MNTQLRLLSRNITVPFIVDLDRSSRRLPVALSLYAKGIYFDSGTGVPIS